ncbi:unnamed protein product [Linum tenue]|uniref:DUF4283 domain-containing protein n=1 Tax=Linum tenue TaxID=586396 RepID=A0AAV0H6Y2_9ROSI|nr:unnamed protein product [Linum tenue]
MGPHRGSCRVDVGFGLFRIVFSTKPDRDRALEKQPWPFRKYLLNLQAWVAPTQAMYDRMASMAFWVQLRGVPHDYSTIYFGRELLQQLGEVLDIGLFGSRTSTGYFLKVKLILDVTIPFRGRLMAESGDSCSQGILAGSGCIYVMNGSHRVGSPCYGGWILYPAVSQFGRLYLATVRSEGGTHNPPASRGKQLLLEYPPSPPTKYVCALRIGISEDDLLVDRKRLVVDMESEGSPTGPLAPADKKTRRSLAFSADVDAA